MRKSLRVSEKLRSSWSGAAGVPRNGRARGHSAATATRPARASARPRRSSAGTGIACDRRQPGELDADGDRRQDRRVPRDERLDAGQRHRPRQVPDPSAMPPAIERARGQRDAGEQGQVDDALVGDRDLRVREGEGEPGDEGRPRVTDAVPDEQRHGQRVSHRDEQPQRVEGDRRPGPRGQRRGHQPQRDHRIGVGQRLRLGREERRIERPLPGERPAGVPRQRPADQPGVAPVGRRVQSAEPQERRAEAQARRRVEARPQHDEPTRRPVGRLWRRRRHRLSLSQRRPAPGVE